MKFWKILGTLSQSTPQKNSNFFTSCLTKIQKPKFRKISKSKFKSEKRYIVGRLSASWFNKLVISRFASLLTSNFIEISILVIFFYKFQCVTVPSQFARHFTSAFNVKNGNWKLEGARLRCLLPVREVLPVPVACAPRLGSEQPECQTRW